MEPSVDFRRANTEPSVDFRKANTELPVHFRRVNMEICVKESGRTGFSSGWQGCSSGFPSGFTLWKSLGAALSAVGKPRPSLLFYLD